MRRQVDHHLARARAVGRRGHAHSRADVWPSLEAVERAVSRLYPEVRFDLDGARDLQVHVERQDLDELLGNLNDTAAIYGGGSVLATVRGEAALLHVLIEAAAPAIVDAERAVLVCLRDPPGQQKNG